MAHKNNDLYKRIYEIVAKIPKGKVTTYGRIAECVGIRSSARMVGWALNAAAGNMELPCHRVINRNGELTGKMYFGGPDTMRELLESEGITFNGEAVNLELHLWEP